VDRVFFDYNYYNGVGEGFGIPNTDLHREVIGFEKTFLQGNASFGLRLPFVETSGDGDVSSSGLGDLTLILKGALINDRQTGNVLSGGMCVTVPTGNSNLFIFNGQKIHDTLLQPWGGFIVNFSDFYLQGFTSIVVPTDSRDVTALFNDVGLGYYLYRTKCDQFLTSIAPTVELHVTTPLNHRGSTTDPLVLPDILDVTAGVNCFFHRRSSLFIGGAVPVTGPLPFNGEAIVQLNFRF
jgi:hypothetical protein